MNVFLSEFVMGHDLKSAQIVLSQRATYACISHFICIHLTVVCINIFSSTHLVILSPQMPQVLDGQSLGIDLHFWGRVLRATSQNVQAVSAPRAISPFHSHSSTLLLLSSVLQD